ncbi:hypothetical protein VTN49DRAFT_7572 [Thermomyces lanuginosus]|uniref:uncharacterized protein n=1 Tax=Thermomyces lanuginosus TaxID=5541 RepID=UPI003744B047
MKTNRLERISYSYIVLLKLEGCGYGLLPVRQQIREPIHSTVASSSPVAINFRVSRHRASTERRTRGNTGPREHNRNQHYRGNQKAKAEKHKIQSTSMGIYTAFMLPASVLIN